MLRAKTELARIKLGVGPGLVMRDLCYVCALSKEPVSSDLLGFRISGIIRYVP